MKKRTAFWLLSAGLVLALLGALLALPGFVGSQAHRPAMEAFASSLTGRKVQIGGKLSLALLPRPEITATDITISGPDKEIITAHALVMDISPLALLRGQLAVQTLDLEQPSVDFPWPLPAGPKSIAPPPWLAALHAHLSNGTVRFGGIGFTEVSADLFTGPDGAVSVSGNGALLGQGVTLSLALGATALDQSAPLSIQAGTLGSSLNFSGTLDADSSLTGNLTAKLPQDITGNATLSVDANGVNATQLTIQQGNTSLSGNASVGFAAPGMNATLSGQNLNLDALARQTQPLTLFWPALPPLSLTLQASNVTLAGQNFPALQTSLTTGPGGLALNSLTLSLPGGGTLNASGSASQAGVLSGQASLTVPDSTALAAAYHLPPPVGWPSAKLSAQLGGTLAAPVLRNLSGTLGQDRVTGNLILTPGRAAGSLGFDHLDLAPLIAWAGQRQPGGFVFDGEISAARADAGPIKLQNLAVDAELDGTLNIRRASANLYGGLAAGSFTLDSSGQVTSAHGFLQLPSATPLAALLPAGWMPPAALTAGRFSVLLAAQGPANALSASAVASLAVQARAQATGKLADVGTLTVTTSPVIDLIHQSASGAVSVQFPEAIRLAHILGFDQGVAFPGAGSVSLRAGFTASANQYGLNDFILSFGALAANGRLMVQNGTVSGQIDADTLALPPLPTTLPLPASLPVQGKIGLNATSVLYAGTPVLGQSSATLTLAQTSAKLDLATAALGNGNLSGSLTATLSATAAPQFNLSLLAQNIDAQSLALPVSFPFSLPIGTINATASLTASGYSPKNWLATLGGTASLTATHGRLGGISLGNFMAALGTPNATAKLRAALASGSTPFSTLNLAGTLAQGNCTLTRGTLTGQNGMIAAATDSGIDFFDRALALRLTLQPAVKPPVSASVLVLGPWSAPKRTAQLKSALGWKPAAP
ncbi:AsmA family protein [Acidocella aromatica]|uniref:Uncharacterized protein involved in outer membrane biogenesis n=1 Tax=Acidocella aromatica TaxID=1303579 RepID=A0A840VK99_9PROT|nr:AsmA family protein [Acidocella aromatica]MBB5371930.1 uncharacterized protein involved in outer membrane biogenesis [Acidocella aromatica]